MAKQNRSSKAKAQKKKRNKTYTGEDAAVRGTKVTRVTAVHKSPLREYWDNNRTQILARLGISGALMVIGYSIFALITWIF